MLPEKFKEPAGFQWGKFTNAEGADIRYGLAKPEGEPKGTMVIVPGFREPAEKYFEVVREMTAKGFAVWVMDWRGQGGSGRFLKKNPQKMYSEGYGEHIETLHQFTQQIIGKTTEPLILMAHSMGAHIGLRYLKEHEGVFDSAILSAPMLNILTGALPQPVARRMAQFAVAAKIGDRYIPGGKNWNEKKERSDNAKKTSDPVRGAVTEYIFKNKPELKAGDPTYRWIHHTFESIDILNDEKYLKSIKTPVLVQISGNDLIVDNAASGKASRILPNCTRVDVPGARHEIWMERDDLRNFWLSKVDAFLKERLQVRAPQPKKPKQNNVPPPKLG